MLYGATPFPYDTRATMLGLQPVMTLRSEIIARAGAHGERERRLRRHRTRRRARIAIGVVACGYADGYPRHAPNGTPVLVCGKKRADGRPRRRWT